MTGRTGTCDRADEPRVSVVVPVRNAAPWIDAQLAALADQEVPVPWEVVVADNGSTDRTRALAERWRDRLALRVVDASARPGVNHARNRGAVEARGELLLFCDGDDIVHPGWVAAYWRSRDGWDMAGGAVEATSLNEARLVKRHPDPQVHGLSSFGWLETFMGCNFAVHRAVHTAIGGFDEAFLGGCDDIDFAFRGQLAGYQLGFVPEAVVGYRLRRTLRASARQHFRYGRTRARLYMKFRSSGMPRRSWKHTVRAYGLAVAHLPQAVSADGRARWVVDVAFLVGLAAGSLDLHTVYLSE